MPDDVLRPRQVTFTCVRSTTASEMAPCNALRVRDARSGALMLRLVHPPDDSPSDRHHATKNHNYHYHYNFYYFHINDYFFHYYHHNHHNNHQHYHYDYHYDYHYYHHNYHYYHHDNHHDYHHDYHHNYHYYHHYYHHDNHHDYHHDNHYNYHHNHHNYHHNNHYNYHHNHYNYHHNNHYNYHYYHYYYHYYYDHNNHHNHYNYHHNNHYYHHHHNHYNYHDYHHNNHYNYHYSYSIHSIHPKKNAEVIKHVRDPQGQVKLEDYWNRNIYHHAVLDLEVKPWEKLNIESEVRAAFDLLKELRGWQQRVNASRPKSGAPHGGFVVLGIRIWPANRSPFLGNVTHQMEQFLVDGFLPWTHFTEDEFTAKYPQCVITGASPLKDVNNNNTMDMFQVLDWVNSSTTWNVYPSLAISVSMCTRIYKTSTGTDAKYGDPCEDNATPPGPSSAYCGDAKKYYHTFDTHYPDLAGYSFNANFSAFIATFELPSAVTEKLCEVKHRYESLDISLALFDIECEDWADACTTKDSNVVRGKSRIRAIHLYSSGTTLAKLKARPDPGCP
ncbi:uncharacterized protein LOC142573976 [Dermacentor variabilis]|uniref:uncharacterized protein LOC142573976 n=1 Tax=Dermacentor variabilis TaxID=34621 RepID=UPI003F5BF4F4